MSSLRAAHYSNTPADSLLFLYIMMFAFSYWDECLSNLVAEYLGWCSVPSTSGKTSQCFWTMGTICLPGPSTMRVPIWGPLRRMTSCRHSHEVILVLDQSESTLDLWDPHGRVLNLFARLAENILSTKLIPSLMPPKNQYSNRMWLWSSVETPEAWRKVKEEDGSTCKLASLTRLEYENTA